MILRQILEKPYHSVQKPRLTEHRDDGSEYCHRDVEYNKAVYRQKKSGERNEVEIADRLKMMAGNL